MRRKKETEICAEVGKIIWCEQRTTAPLTALSLSGISISDFSSNHGAWARATV